MARYDFNAQRLFVEAALAEGATLALGGEQANYLRNVLRLGPGDAILLFNGRDGEWRAELAEAGRRGVTLQVGARTRAQEGGPDIVYLFAPLKRARLDYMVQKATEMGVARLSPAWFIFLSLLGSIAFALPIVLLWRRRDRHTIGS